MTEQSHITNRTMPQPYDETFGSCTKLVCTDYVAVDNYDASNPNHLSGKFEATYSDGTHLEFQAVLSDALFRGVVPYCDENGTWYLLTNRSIVSALARQASTLERFSVGEVELPDESDADAIIETLKVPSPYDVLSYDPQAMWMKIWYRAGLLVRMVDGRLVIDADVPLELSKYRVAKCNYYGEEDAMCVGVRKQNAVEDAIPVFANDEDYADNNHGNAVSLVCLDMHGNGIPYVPSNPLNHSARLEITYADGAKVVSSVAFCDVLLCGVMRQEGTGALVGDRRVLAAVADLAAQCRTLDRAEEVVLPSAEDADALLERYRVPEVPLEYGCAERACNEWIGTWEKLGLVVRIGSEDDVQYVVRDGNTRKIGTETPRQMVERLVAESSV